jgi:hypothetical protein
VVVVFLTDYNTTPTKVVLICFGLLVGLWQFKSEITASLTALTSNTGSKFDDGNMPANQSIQRGGLKSLTF